MDAMEAKMLEWRKKVPSKRQLTSTFGKIVQQKSVAVLYTPSEQDRIKTMTDLIAAATSEYERGEHWDRIIAVVDALSSASNRNVLRESIRFLRLRLGDPSPRVVILALTLTEAVVKNCGHLVHLEIATEPFMHELEALHKAHNGKCSRDSLEIAERILDLVQAWGEAFLPYRHDYPLFIETYHNMRKRGVKFPAQYDETKVPVLTPPSATTATGAGTMGRSADTSSVSSASSALAGLSHAELYRVAVNITEMFEDMLHEAHKADSSLSNEGVILELALQARELVQRMEGVIQTAVAEGSESLGDYLAVNDNLNAALKRYDELSARRAAARASTSNQHEHERNGGASSSNRTSDSARGNDDDDDDPFAEFVQQRAGGSRSSAATKSSSKQQAVLQSNQTENDDDDDPFASFVQQRASKILGSSDGDAFGEKMPAPVETNLIDLWDDLPESNQLSASSVSVPAAPVSDLWGDDDLLAVPSSTRSSVQSAPAATTKPAMSQPALIDDLWGDMFSSPAVATSVAPAAAPSTPFDPFATFQEPATAPAPAAAIDPFATFVSSSPAPVAPTSDPFATFVAPASTSALSAQASTDPFDLMDFSHKTSISSPSNPFDLVSMPPASMRPSFSSPLSPPPQQPQQPQTKSFNPFDF